MPVPSRCRFSLIGQSTICPRRRWQTYLECVSPKSHGSKPPVTTQKWRPFLASLMLLGLKSR